MHSRRQIIYAFILLLFLAELTLFNRIRAFGVRPELLLICTVFFGLHFGIARGMEIGFLSGILKDIFTVSAFGINTFSFLFIGFLSGLLKDKLIKGNFIAQFFLSLLAVYIASIAHLIYLSGSIGAHFWKAVLYKGLYTGFLAPFIFFALTRISQDKKTSSI